MKKLLVTVTVILLVGNAVVAQNKYASDSLKAKLVAKCDCSKLVVYPYFYYESPNDPTHSNFRLRFDFQHKGNAICIPEFKGTITIVQGGNQVKLSVSSMRTVANTQQTRIFTIPQSQIPVVLQLVQLHLR